MQRLDQTGTTLHGMVMHLNHALVITQTGGGCRATNYVAFLRKALKEAGYPQIPVITISAQRFEKNEGFDYTVSFILDAVKALCAEWYLQWF